MEEKLPEKVYITHSASLAPYLAADFFVLGDIKYEEQGYEMEVCEYVIKFLKKYPMYKYAFSDDNAHWSDDWEVDFTGWTDVTDWLKDGD